MPTILPPRATALLLALVLALLLLRLGACRSSAPTSLATRASRSRCSAPRSGSRRRSRASPGSRSRRSTTGSRAPRSGPARRNGSGRAPALGRWPLLLLTGATALFGARLYGSAAGLHAGFVAGTVAPAVRLRPRRLDGHAARGRDDARDRPHGPAPARGSPGAPPCVAAAAAAGLATLAKGPLGLLLPGLVVGGYLLSDARVAPPARAPGAGRALRLRARRASLVRRDPARPGGALPGRLPPEPQPAALHVDDPQPPRAVLVLPAGAAARALPVVGALWSPASCAARPASRAPTASCCCGCCSRSSSSRSPPPSCPATSSRACPRSRS